MPIALRNRFASLVLPILALSGAAYSPLVHAALGEAETSVASDAEHAHSSVKSIQHENYRVHELQQESGTELREFVGQDGRVFAVAWSGPSVPDLRQAFGRYFDTYVDAAQARSTSRGHFALRQDDLVVQSSGHMRAFSGRAYLSSQIPSGMSLPEIR